MTLLAANAQLAAMSRGCYLSISEDLLLVSPRSTRGVALRYLTNASLKGSFREFGSLGACFAGTALYNPAWGPQLAPDILSLVCRLHSASSTCPPPQSAPSSENDSLAGNKSRSPN